jgi:hypothetical protein
MNTRLADHRLHCRSRNGMQKYLRCHAGKSALQITEIKLEMQSAEPMVQQAVYAR